MKRLAMILAIAATAEQMAQAPASQPVTSAYDVVLIHKSTSNQNHWQVTDSGFAATGTTVQVVVDHAFGVFDDQVVGAPSWLSTEHYDFAAKLEVPDSETTSQAKLADAAPDLFQTRLLDLLKSRLHLQMHTETRDRNTMTLALVHPGKLTALTENPPFEWHYAAGYIHSRGITMDGLAKALSYQLGTPVTDRTQLPGKFDITLQWNTDVTNARSELPSSLPSALVEDLGLGLKTTKTPTTMYVIDHIDRPTEN